VQEIGSCLEDRVTRARICWNEFKKRTCDTKKLRSLENRQIVMMFPQENEGSKKIVDCTEKEGEVPAVC